jgi:hypothetical protein
MGLRMIGEENLSRITERENSSSAGGTTYKQFEIMNNHTTKKYLHYNGLVTALVTRRLSIWKHEGQQRGNYSGLARPHNKLVDRSSLVRVKNRTHEIFH